MNPISLFLTYLSNPGALLSLGAAGLIMLVYFVGPYVGLYDPARLIVVAALVVIYLVLLGVLALRKRRKKDQAAADLETSMIMEADQSVAMAEAGQKKVREDARRELVAAIDVLKKSNLADGRGGKAALHVLPWYLVMGSSYSGKSSLIRNSGLQSPGKGPGELRGIGASANCEWWFTNHAVFLEADQRFTSSAGAKAVEGEWEAYMSTLSKQRTGTALNGVVIALSATELMQRSVSEQEDMARLLRKRLDTMANELKLVFPVYLMITKMDQVQGFNEFFAGLSGLGRDQILGATLRADQMRKPNPEKLVAVEYDRLYQNLCRRRQMRLIQAEHAANSEGTFLFPLQFRSLGDNLQRFVQIFCEPNAYGRNPLLRGFYFTSSGGEGEASDHVLHEMNRVLGLPAPSLPVVSPGKPLFLRGFFRKVLVPDRDIARPTRGAARRTRLIRRGLQYAALGVLAVLIGNLGVSAFSSLMLIKSVGRAVDNAKNASFGGDQDRVLDSVGRLPYLNDLQALLVEQEREDTGLAKLRRMGLKRGGALTNQALRFYLERYVEIVVRPYEVDLKLWMLRSQIEGIPYDKCWQRYQAYRLLFRPEMANDETLVPSVLRELLAEADEKDGKGVATIVAQENLEKHVAFAMSHAEGLKETVKNAKVPFARQVQTDFEGVMEDKWTAVDYYNREISKFNETNQYRITLADLNDGAAMLVAGDPTASEIPGSYTKLGWEGAIRKELGDVDGFLARYSWIVPATVTGPPEELKADLLSLYKRNYIETWRAFLSSVELREPDGTRAGQHMLEDLVKENSPYKRLLSAAAENLSMAGKKSDADKPVADIMESITLSFDALLKFQDDDKLGAEVGPQEKFDELVRNLVSALAGVSMNDKKEQKAFQFTKGMAEAGSDSENPIDPLLSFAVARSSGRGVEGDADYRAAFNSLLRLPALHAWQAFMRDTEKYLDNEWKAAISAPFGADFNLKYPFSKGVNGDVNLEQFSNFFGSEGKLPLFAQTYLKPYVVDLMEYRPKEFSAGSSLQLNADARKMLIMASRINAAFFGAGAKNARLDVNYRLLQSPPVKEQIWVKHVFFDVCGKSVNVGTGSFGRNGDFVWPESGGAATNLSVQVGDSQDKISLATATGEWGLFKLIDQAASKDIMSSNKIKLTWQKERSGGGQIVVPIVLTFEGRETHPIGDDLFDFRCPDKISQLP